MTRKPTDKSKDANCIAIMPRLVVYGYGLSVPVSKIVGIKEKARSASKFHLQHHVPPAPIFLRQFKNDQDLYRIINSNFSVAQKHLAKLKPVVLVQAFIMESTNEQQDRIDDFIFGEVLSAMPKPLNQEVTKSIVSKLVESSELLDAVVEGFELTPRSKNCFPTNEIAKLLGISPQTVDGHVKKTLFESTWNRYASQQNLPDYRTMVSTFRSHSNTRLIRIFFDRLTKLDPASDRFSQFAQRAVQEVLSFQK